MECYTYLRNIQDLLSDGKTPYERRVGEPFKGPSIPFGTLAELTGGWENSMWKTIRRTAHSIGSNGRVSSNFNERSIQTAPIWEESFSWNISRIGIDREENSEKETFWLVI